jgi:antitoxin (DNA-binding transcriptional repressor) of toxin-antitoxin stability system
MGVPAVELWSGNLQLNELVAEAERAGELVLTRGGEAVAKIIRCIVGANRGGREAHAEACSSWPMTSMPRPKTSKIISDPWPCSSIRTHLSGS